MRYGKIPIFMRLNLFLVIVLFFALTAVFGCRGKATDQIILATTTSCHDSGILDELIKDFKDLYPQYDIKPVAVGSGEALAMGQRGDADVLLVHSPEDEKAFIRRGFGVNRSTIMYNHFIVLGPSSDPAGIKGQYARAAFEKINDTRSVFVSRSDESGTHKKELSFWNELSIDPAQSGQYVQTGQGMAETIRIADQKQGYTLSDTGTYLALKDTISLEILSKKDEALLNEYSVIEINPDLHKGINKDGARAVSKYLKTRGKLVIKFFGKDKFGQSLFSVN